MHVRIFGFSAALILLGGLGFLLVQTEPYGAPPGEEEAAPAPAPPPPVEEEAVEEEPAPDELAVEEEEPDPEELRQQAEEAQRRVAEHLEAARLAQEEALRAQRRAGILPTEEEEAEEAAIEVPPTLEALGQRIEELEARLLELETVQDVSDEELAALEEELEYLEERGEFLEANRQERIVALDQNIDSLAQAFETLSTGNGDVGGALDNLAQRLASTSAEAAQYAGEEEARWIDRAQYSLENAREALDRQDLFAARIALGIALRQAQAARRAAETTGPNALAP